MLRNAEVSEPDIFRPLVPKNLPNGGHQKNVPEIKKHVSFLENKIRGKLDLGKGLHFENPRLPDCDEMPRLESSPLLDGLDGVPASPEMPTLVPFVFDGEDAKHGLDARLSVNGYYCLNKENMNLSTPETASPTTKKRKPGRPKRKPKGVYSAELATTDKRFQPVVLLKRLSVEPEVVDANVGDREDSSDSWSQWPEEYEGCSYDDYVCDGEGVVNFPEVDMIDGVEFLSFLQEGDVKDYALKSNQTIIFPSDTSCTDAESCPDGLGNLKDDHAFIVPTKTRDITQIKGWKRKLFLEDNFASSTPGSMSPSFLESDSADRDDESSQEALLLERSSMSGSNSATPFEEKDQSRKDFDFDGRTRGGALGEGKPTSGEDCDSKKASDGESDEESGREMSDRSFQNSLRLEESDVENPQTYGDDSNDNVSNIANEKRSNGGSKTKSSQDSEDELLDSNHNNDAIRDSEISFQNSLRLPGTPPDGDQYLEDEDEEKDSKTFGLETKEDVTADGESVDTSNPLECGPEEGTLQENNVLKLGEQPDLYGSAKSAAFSSRSLDDFLDKHSALDVNFLMQCDPVVSFIPSNDPVLKVGLLKVEDDGRKRRRPFGNFPRNNRYAAQSTSSMRPNAFKNSGGNVIKPNRVLSTSKFENVKPDSKNVPAKSPNPSSDKNERRQPEVLAESREVRPTLVFADDDSNVSSVSESSNSTGTSWRKESMSPDFSLDSNERREACLDNALLFESNDPDSRDKDYENFSIEYYEPVTYEERTLSESRGKDPTIVKQTVWSTKDTVHEERLFYDLLCALKSPDSYLISKIKFYDESGADVNELLTEDDAREIAKSLYMGYSSVQEMVKEVTELQAVKKARVARSMQLARERKRKKEAQLKTVRGFVEWYRADTLTPSEELATRKRSRNRVPADLASPISAEDRPQVSAEEVKKKRKIRVPARFMDSAFLSEEGQTIFKDKRNSEKTYSRNKLPILRPHSAALLISFDDPDGTTVSPSTEPVTKTECVSSDESPVLLSSPDLPCRSEKTPSVGSPPMCSKSESESERVLASSPGVESEKLTESVSSSPLVSISDVRSLSKDDDSFSIQEDALPKSPSPKDVAPRSTDESNGNAELSLPTVVGDPPELTVKTVSAPDYDSVLDLVDNTNNKDQQETSDKSPGFSETRKVPQSPGSRKDYLGIELSNGVHTITPKNSTIQKIKMNLNSAVNIDTKARNVMQNRQAVPPARTWNITNVLHLIPLNEYHWKPPNSSDNSPTIKSFIINKPNSDATLIFNQDTVNMPLAAVAQPVANKQSSAGQIFLLYGSLKDMNLPVTEIPVAEKSGSSKGLSVRVGQQELFLSCSVTLAKAPVRLNALVGKVVTPLLVFPALTSNTKDKDETAEASKPGPDKTGIVNDQRKLGLQMFTAAKTVVPKPVAAAPLSVASSESQDSTVTSEMSSGMRSILTPSNNSSTIPLKTLVPARGAQAQNAQHLRIFMKDNKLTVQNRETQNSNTKNVSSFLSPTQRAPLTFANATGGPTRPVQHVRPLQLAGPVATTQRPVVPSNAGPRKVFILSPTTDRRSFLPPGVFRSVIKAPAAKAVASTELVTPKVINPLTGKVQPLTVCGQSAGPKSELLKTTVSLPEGFRSPPGSTQFICLQATNRHVHQLPKGPIQGDSNVLLLSKEGDVQVMGIGSELSSSQLSSRLENSQPAQSLQEDANLEISITDVRTCSPATFGSGPDSSDQSEAANRSSEIVQVSSDEVVDVASEEEAEEDSMWVNNEGEPCFVMRLPAEDDDEVEELPVTDGPHVVPCS